MLAGLFSTMLFISCFLLFSPLYFLRFINNCISFEVLNFYLGRYKTKIREESKRQNVKNNKRQEVGNKKHIVETGLTLNANFIVIIMLLRSSFIMIKKLGSSVIL